MPRQKHNARSDRSRERTELDRLIEEAIVDAHDDSEQRTGFYTMLESTSRCHST